MTEWKSVPDTDMEVSQDGRVRRDGVEWIPCVASHGYRVVRCSDKVVRLHRLIATAFIPNPECKPFVDHIDRNKLNNAITNLRWATIAENNRNTAARGVLPKGVCKSGSRYVAKIWIDGHLTYLGTFDTPELAAQAYAAKALELFGEFSGL